MIDINIFQRALGQYQDTVKATRDAEDNSVVAMNRVLNIDSRSLAELSISITEELKKECYPEELQISAAATYALQIGILAGRQEAIENTSSS